MTGDPARPAAFITHPAFLAPGFGRHHPLSTARQAATVQLVEALGWLPDDARHTPPLPDRATLERFHTTAYLDALTRASADLLATADDRARFNLGTMECPVFEGLWDRARASVGGAILAADLALSGHIAFHPGGGTHHGRPGRASGFCYLNDPVFAILRLLDGGMGSVAYIDLDAHHGDGVEAAFADEPRVAVFSIHEAQRWPGTGATAASAEGRIVNLALPRAVGDASYRAAVTPTLTPWLQRHGREAVVVTLGADALDGDPLSTMGLSNRTLWHMTDLCLASARHTVVLGGGGYNPWTTTRLWAGQWGRLNGRWPFAPLPPAARAILRSLDSDLIDTDQQRDVWTTRLEDPAPPELGPKSETP